MDLFCRGYAVSAIDLCHQECFLPIAVAQRSTHAEFTFSTVVIPAVVEKVDAFTQRGTDDANAFFRSLIRLPQVIAANSHHRDFFASASERSIRNSVLRLRAERLWAQTGSKYACRRKLEKCSPCSHCCAAPIEPREIREQCLHQVHFTTCYPFLMRNTLRTTSNNS